MTQRDFRLLVRAGSELYYAAHSYERTTDAHARLKNSALACWAQAFETKPLRAERAVTEWANAHPSIANSIIGEALRLAGDPRKFEPAHNFLGSS